LNGRPYLHNITTTPLLKATTGPLVEMSSTVQLNVFFTVAKFIGGGYMIIPINGLHDMNIMPERG
jgi:hypothetical protein